MGSKKGYPIITAFFGISIVVVAIIVIICVYKVPSHPHKGSQNFTYTSLLNNKEKLNINKSSPKRKENNSSSYLRKKHPTLEYQRRSSFDTVPANYGDPIRPSNSRASPNPSRFRKMYGRNNKYAYPLGGGPYPGEPVGVPVQQGAMKLSSERDGIPFYSGFAENRYRSLERELDPGLPYPYQNQPLKSYDFFKPYGPNQPSIQKEIVYADTPFYNKPREKLVGYGKSPRILSSEGDIPFVGSADSFAPFPEVLSSWEKVGIIQTVNPDNNAIMNIFRRQIAPLQDLFEYSVQDKNGFVVPLKETYLEDGDIIHSVPGRESLGKWKFNDYLKYKYIWM